MFSNETFVFSGLQIIFNLDEVAFIQNLVFYVESAYCIPVSTIYWEIYVINPSLS